MFGPELIEAFARFKAIWDPKNRMDPGKVVQANSLTANLRLGPDYALPQLETHFQYPQDENYFARAVNRCIGVGKCRRGGGGTMCPSYMVTHEEQHCTRGRARLLQEMANGRLIDGWRNEHVKQSLDLCLSCKGCKGECPAGVDVATYKAEFLAHYYEGRRRPRSAYAFGLIDRWARVASWAPTLANAMLRLPVTGRMGKWVAGMAPQRTPPRFARRTFRQWFSKRSTSSAVRASSSTRSENAKHVILWPDTFHNHFYPEVLQAAVGVLERAGCQVMLPEVRLCCGRPLYDFGMLDRARDYLWRVMEELRPQIREEIPIVGVEPSCVAVFRDELINLFPGEADARWLSSQTFTLAEYLQKMTPTYQPPRLSGRVLFHGHCHQKALMGTEADVALLRATGLEVETPETGCCGMAGSFGFQREHYDLSQQIGEHMLLPRVRAADEHAYIVTDGFSCREQIVQATGRRVWHLAEVLAQQHTAAV